VPSAHNTETTPQYTHPALKSVSYVDVIYLSRFL
jgi:hypothetical protein